MKQSDELPNEEVSNDDLPADITPEEASPEQVVEEDATPDSEIPAEQGDIVPPEGDDRQDDAAPDEAAPESSELSDPTAPTDSIDQPEATDVNEEPAAEELAETEATSDEAEAYPADAEEPAPEAEPDQSIEDTPAPDVQQAQDIEAPAETDTSVPELVHELEYAPPSKKDDDEPPARFTSVSEARATLEGFLFSSNEPLSVNRLCKLMGNMHHRSVRGLLLELQMEYDNRSGALQIVEIAGGFQMATRPHLAEWMFRLHKHRRRSPLTTATLETLAIIAYKQPITKAELEIIRGVESSGTMRTLQDLGLVEVGGRKEVIGRPQLYITTDQFLKVFGLKSLSDLPSITELKHLFADQQRLNIKNTESTEQNNVEMSSEDAPITDDPSSAAEAEQPHAEEFQEADEESSELDEDTDLEQSAELEDDEDTEDDEEDTEDDDSDDLELEEPVGEEESKETAEPLKDKQDSPLD